MIRPSDLAILLSVVAILLSVMGLVLTAMVGLVLAVSRTGPALPVGPLVNLHTTTIHEAPSDGFLDDGGPDVAAAGRRAVCRVCGTVVGYNGGDLDGVECLRCGCRSLIPVRPPEGGGDEDDPGERDG